MNEEMNSFTRIMTALILLWDFEESDMPLTIDGLRTRINIDDDGFTALDLHGNIVAAAPTARDLVIRIRTFVSCSAPSKPSITKGS